MFLTSQRGKKNQTTDHVYLGHLWSHLDQRMVYYNNNSLAVATQNNNNNKDFSPFSFSIEGLTNRNQVKTTPRLTYIFSQFQIRTRKSTPTKLYIKNDIPPHSRPKYSRHQGRLFTNINPNKKMHTLSLLRLSY